MVEMNEFYLPNAGDGERHTFYDIAMDINDKLNISIHLLFNRSAHPARPKSLNCGIIGCGCGCVCFVGRVGSKGCQ